MFKKTILSVFLMGTLFTYAQVGIGTTSPTAGSILDIASPDKGLLIPRVALIATNNPAPITPAPVEGMMIYNTAIAGTSPNIVTPGFYFWNGTLWTRVATGGAVTKDWSVTGNGDIDATSDFIGTTNNQDLRFKTNDIERMRILNAGVVINTLTPLYSGDRFTVLGAAGEYAINGYSSTNGVGVYGENTGTGYGVWGLAANIGIRGTGTFGVWGETTLATGQGMRAVNTHASGTGLIAVGNNSTPWTLAGGSGAALNGVPFGAVAFGNRASDGYGILAAGNNLGTSIITGGGGGSFTGNQWGVYANAILSGNAGNRAAFAGNYIEHPTSTQTVYVGARIGGTNYKILGTGSASVSTTMPTRDGERILFAPEAPENWFFDLGEVQLIDGKATVQLDPLFIDCISDAKPFKVFVQGAEEIMGNVKVTRNQRDKSFSLEDSGGASNGTVQFKIYGIWKGKEDLRFPEFLPEYHLNPDYIEKVEVKERNPQVIKGIQNNESSNK